MKEQAIARKVFSWEFSFFEVDVANIYSLKTNVKMFVYKAPVSGVFFPFSSPLFSLFGLFVHETFPVMLIIGFF